MKNKFLSVLYTLVLTGILLVPVSAQTATPQPDACVRCTILGLWNQNCELHQQGSACEKPTCPANPCTPIVPPVEKPELPEMPDVPEIPEVPELPEQPDVPSIPDIPEVPEQPDDNDSSIQAYERQVAALVNKERAANGLSALQLNGKLSDGARKKSQDMKNNNYFDHTSPTYGSPFDMMGSLGITYSAAGENIAMGQSTPEAVMTAWMNSDGHRANILSSKYTTIGVGYVPSGNYWTQWFIR